MMLFRDETWSHENNAYYVKGFALRLKPSEMLIVTDALRLLRNNADTHPADRQKADAMLAEIRKRVLE